MTDRYFRCAVCGATCQGWNVAHWYRRWHEDDCAGGDADVVEVAGPEPFQACTDPTCNHLGCEQMRAATET